MSDDVGIFYSIIIVRAKDSSRVNMKLNPILLVVIYALLLITAFCITDYAKAAESTATQSLELTPKEAIKIYTDKYDVPFNWIYETAKGESGFRQDAVHDGGMGKGCTGYWKDTFYGHKKKYLEKYPEIEDLDYSSCLDQLHLMTIAIKEGRGWEWTVFCRKFGVRGKTCNWYFKKLDKGMIY